MTNDEIRMTKEARKSNDETRLLTFILSSFEEERRAPSPASGFVIWNSFDIRIL